MVNTYLWTRSIKVAGRGHEEAGVAGGGGDDDVGWEDDVDREIFQLTFPVLIFVEKFLKVKVDEYTFHGITFILSQILINFFSFVSTEIVPR